VAVRLVDILSNLEHPQKTERELESQSFVTCQSTLIGFEDAMKRLLARRRRQLPKRQSEKKRPKSAAIISPSKTLVSPAYLLGFSINLHL
jgi:hypothetical protein